MDISITVPGRGEVTADDLTIGRGCWPKPQPSTLAELEKFAAKDPATAAEPGASGRAA